MSLHSSPSTHFPLLLLSTGSSCVSMEVYHLKLRQYVLLILSQVFTLNLFINPSSLKIIYRLQISPILIGSESLPRVVLCGMCIILLLSIFSIFLPAFLPSSRPTNSLVVVFCIIFLIISLFILPVTCLETCSWCLELACNRGLLPLPPSFLLCSPYLKPHSLSSKRPSVG